MDAAVSLSPDDPFEPLPAEMFSIDVSLAGIAFDGPSELKGDRYQIQFALPSGALVKGAGRVVWKHPNSFSHTYGVAFEQVNWWERLKLVAFIRRYLRTKGFVSHREKLIRLFALSAGSAAVLTFLLAKIFR